MRIALHSLGLLATVLGLLASTTAVASAVTTAQPSSLSRSAALLVSETCVRVADLPAPVSPGLQPTIAAVQVGQRCPRFVGSAVGSCVATETGGAAAEDFVPPKVYSNRHGQLTNGQFTIDEAGMAPHQTGSLAAGKSQWAYGVNAEQATLDAAAYAEKNGLWVGNKAKVPVTDGVVGAVGRTGEPTSWINVYKTNTGFVHGPPGNAR